MKNARRKWIGICLAGCAALAAWSSAARAGSMTFVMQPFPPFVVDEKGAAQGPFPELVLEACKVMKTACKLEVYPWRRALKMAEEGEADGILVIQNLPERDRYFYLTEPIINSSYGVLAHAKAGLHYTGPKDLDGYTIGVYGPSATSQAAEEIMTPTTKLVQEVDNLTAMKKLAAMRYGDKGVAVMNVDVGHYLMKQNNITGLKFAGEIRKIEYVIGLSRKKLSAKEAARFHAALRELMKNGTVRSIAAKYGMKAAS